MIITYKHGIYELPHELPNDLTLRKLGNIRKVSKRPEWQPSAQPPAKVKALPILAGNPWKPETKLPPLCPTPPGNQSQPQISREPLQAPMPQPLDQGRLIQYARKISRKTNISSPAPPTPSPSIRTRAYVYQGVKNLALRKILLTHQINDPSTCYLTFFKILLLDISWYKSSPPEVQCKKGVL